MDKNELNISKNEISTNVKEKTENVYGLASLIRIFLARLIDVVISSIPGLIVVWAVKPQGSVNWGYTGLVLGVGLAAIILTFVIIPYFIKGNTIGKLICGIRLKRSKGDKKVKWYMLLARETYFLIIPWLVSLIFFAIATGILVAQKPANPNDKVTGFSSAEVIYQLGYVFFFLWFVFICLTIKVQPEHQSGIDIKFGLYVVYKDPIKTKKVIKETVKENIMMTEQPGNFAKDNLEQLRNDEKTKYNKSISLDDLDIKTSDNLLSDKKDEDDKKAIEGDK